MISDNLKFRFKISNAVRLILAPIMAIILIFMSPFILDDYISMTYILIYSVCFPLIAIVLYLSFANFIQGFNSSDRLVNIGLFFASPICLIVFITYLLGAVIGKTITYDAKKHFVHRQVRDDYDNEKSALLINVVLMLMIMIGYPFYILFIILISKIFA